MTRFSEKTNKIVQFFFRPFSSNWNIETNKSIGNTGLVPFVKLPLIINFFLQYMYVFGFVFLCEALFVFFFWLPGRFFEVKFTRKQRYNWERPYGKKRLLSLRTSLRNGFFFYFYFIFLFLLFFFL